LSESDEPLLAVSPEVPAESPDSSVEVSLGLGSGSGSGAALALTDWDSTPNESVFFSDFLSFESSPMVTVWFSNSPCGWVSAGPDVCSQPPCPVVPACYVGSPLLFNTTAAWRQQVRELVFRHSVSWGSVGPTVGSAARPPGCIVATVAVSLLFAV